MTGVSVPGDRSFQHPPADTLLEREHMIMVTVGRLHFYFFIPLEIDQQGEYREYSVSYVLL